MLVITTSSELQQLITQFKAKNETIALVPTMGNLHDGHLNLVSLAHQHASRVIVSVFVNPLQFNQVADLEHYPRTLEQDVKLCEQHEVDIVFAPSNNEIYPDNNSESRLELPELSQISKVLEGESRPGHFSGVVTVVKKLFELTQPDYAIFGEKDFQQLLIIRHMVSVLKIPVKIIASETIRESSGLAMSSRNTKLTTEQRQQAAQIYAVLNFITEQLRSGNTQYTELSQDGISQLSKQGFRLDYLSICDCDNLQPAVAGEQGERVILIALWLGDTRLIDNIRV